MAEESQTIVGFNPADAAGLLGMLESYLPRSMDGIDPNNQLSIAIGKTNVAIQKSAADSSSPVQLYFGNVTLHSVNGSNQRVASSYVVSAANLAPTGDIAAGKLVIVIREDLSNKWFIVWELC